MPETSPPDPLPRLLWLHRSLHEAPQRALSAKELEDQYDAWGLERKTKGRDLAALAQWAGPGPAALRYDRSRRTWILERSFEVPQGLLPRLPVSDATAQVDADLSEAARIAKVEMNATAPLAGRISVGMCFVSWKGKYAADRVLPVRSGTEVMDGLIVHHFFPELLRDARFASPWAGTSLVMAFDLSGL